MIFSKTNHLGNQFWGGRVWLSVFRNFSEGKRIINGLIWPGISTMPIFRLNLLKTC